MMNLVVLDKTVEHTYGGPL